MSEREVLSIEEESKQSYEKEKKSEPQQYWPDLQKDLVSLILEKLPWSERLRLSLVCKTWKECFHEIKNTHEFLPWIMCYKWHAINYGRVESICKVADPFAQKCFTVEEEEATNGTEREIFVSAVPCTSSHGWVLFVRFWLVFSREPNVNQTRLN
ncbi:hypothetical protein Dsin_009830 [Dipteronia sinensis]|uniref:F-box domain-containing protein n=1 Tax=Dipteronia sinensis TaxID=43782 RepID=A0AAE0EDU6_9ROSI|nr:hypothetical protein Dsin_009830 [Dipteronia sinensis]